MAWKREPPARMLRPRFHCICRLAPRLLSLDRTYQTFLVFYPVLALRPGCSLLYAVPNQTLSLWVTELLLFLLSASIAHQKPSSRTTFTSGQHRQNWTMTAFHTYRSCNCWITAIFSLSVNICFSRSACDITNSLLCLYLSLRHVIFHTAFFFLSLAITLMQIVVFLLFGLLLTLVDLRR